MCKEMGQGKEENMEFEMEPEAGRKFDVLEAKKSPEHALMCCQFWEDMWHLTGSLFALLFLTF